MLDSLIWLAVGYALGYAVTRVIDYFFTAYGKFKINSTDIEADVYRITLDQPIVPGQTKYITLKIEDDSQE